MATTIKIHFADGRDRDAQIDITPEHAKLVSEFLNKVHYGDIYHRIADFGDGNKLGSASDVKSRACQEGLLRLRRVFAEALSDGA